MKILILNPILYSGKGLNSIPTTIKDTMIYNMCLGFKSLGHTVTLCAVDEYRPSVEEEYDFDIHFFKTEMTRLLPDALPFSWGIYKFLRKHSGEYDMILTSEVFGFHSLFAALVAPHKTLIWHELCAHQKRFFTIPSRIWHYVAIPLFFRKVRIVVGRSERAIRFISQFMPQVSPVFVDHGINLDKFRLYETKSKQFISSSRLIKQKHVDIIIKKFGEFLHVDGYSDFRLIVAGGGEAETELKDLVKSLDIERNVEFVGFLSQVELNKYVSESCAVLVATSRDSNMVSIPEAIVSGTPVITNMVPNLAEFINEKKLGIARDGWDYTDMIKIVEDNEYYSSNCRAIRESLSTRAAAQKLIYIYEGTASK